ncbi:MAG: hypothetical protein L6R35_006324 [Caloplaca aegaea]|nr:MAG: hypothetical protein L6R35_006324 [Caloplaca aegaea]
MVFAVLFWRPICTAPAGPVLPENERTYPASCMSTSRCSDYAGHAYVVLTWPGDPYPWSQMNSKSSLEERDISGLSGRLVTESTRQAAILREKQVGPNFSYQVSSTVLESVLINKI